jgi:hypothetical protein
MLATLIIQKLLSFLPFGGGGGGATSLVSHGVGVLAGAFSEGGPVRGPGTSTSDSIPARLSDGEYVVRAAVVRQLGVGFFDLLNAVQHTTVPVSPSRFADGGLAVAADEPTNGIRGANDRTIHVVVDAHPDLVVRALETREGQSAVIGVAKKNRNAFTFALGSR